MLQKLFAVCSPLSPGVSLKWTMDYVLHNKNIRKTALHALGLPVPMN
jgi:hypothetical protein